MQTDKESTNITGPELVGSPFEKMAKDILEKDTISQDELEMVFKLDEMFELTEITVSAAETRQVRPFESNNYHASAKYDLTGAHKLIKHKVADMPAAKRMSEYIKLRKAFMALIEKKTATMEDKLRDIIHKQQQNDGISSK
jgi:hypothetical protein